MGNTLQSPRWPPRRMNPGPLLEAYELGNGISLSGFIRRSLPTSLLLRVGIMEGVCPVGIASRFSHSEIFCQVEHVGDRLGCSFLNAGTDSWFVLSYPRFHISRCICR